MKGLGGNSFGHRGPWESAGDLLQPSGAKAPSGRMQGLSSDSNVIARRGMMLLLIIYPFSTQDSAPAQVFSPLCPGWGFLWVRRAGAAGCALRVVFPSNQRMWSSANELFSLFKADILFLSRPYQGLVAIQVPFESPVISPLCPSISFQF